MVYTFFDSNTGLSVNEKLAQELRKPFIKTFKQRKVYTRFKDNNSAVDFAEMGSLTSFNFGVNYLLYVIIVFTKYVWVKPLKDKK